MAAKWGFTVLSVISYSANQCAWTKNEHGHYMIIVLTWLSRNIGPRGTSTLECRVWVLDYDSCQKYNIFIVCLSFLYLCFLTCWNYWSGICRTGCDAYDLFLEACINCWFDEGPKGLKITWVRWANVTLVFSFAHTKLQQFVALLQYINQNTNTDSPLILNSGCCPITPLWVCYSRLESKIKKPAGIKWAK